MCFCLEIEPDLQQGLPTQWLNFEDSHRVLEGKQLPCTFKGGKEKLNYKYFKNCCIFYFMKFFVITKGCQGLKG